MGPLAAAAATIANVGFYYLLTRGLGEPFLMLSDSPTRDLVPMQAWEVILFSLIFSIPAGIVFAILARANRKPVRNFMIISFVVLVLSIFLPLRIPIPPVAMTAKLGLVTMHVIGAIIVVGVLVLASRRRTASPGEG